MTVRAESIGADPGGDLYDHYSGIELQRAQQRRAAV